MIEALSDVLQGDLLPSRGGLARRAGLREGTVVRVLVAIGALAEWNADVLRLAIGTVGVALRALHRRVQAGERVTGLGVIELGLVDSFPVDEVMAEMAVGPQSALVKVLVAGHAGRGQTKVGAVQILFLDGRAFRGRDVGGVVALVAVYSSVLALKQISGFFVIEGLDIPLDEGKVLAVVIGVAASASLA